MDELDDELIEREADLLFTTGGSLERIKCYGPRTVEAILACHREKYGTLLTDTNLES